MIHNLIIFQIVHVTNLLALGCIFDLLIHFFLLVLLFVTYAIGSLNTEF